MSAKERIYDFIASSRFPLTVAELCKQLNIPYRERFRLTDLLTDLCEEEKIFLGEDGKYGTAEQLGLLQGTVTGNERGFAFFTPIDAVRFENDYFIPRKFLRGALHGDKVLAQPLRHFPQDGEKNEVRVVKIVSRGYSEIVGTFRRDRHAGYLIPDEKKYCTDIYIPLSNCSHIKNNVKAVAKITSYPYGKSPGGEIIEVLGDEDDFFAEELSIIRSHGLREVFPPAVEKEAAKQERRGISPRDLTSRTDFRDKLIITIDGEDTRDIDDAVSLEKIGEDYLLGVHIADVTHYVERRSVLDIEAFERGTSAYFPDRVYPMLPKPLSNGICSLNEGEDRLTLSCIMRVNKKGVVVDRQIVEGIIRSSHKTTYTEITKILDGDEKTRQRYADICPLVELCGELTRILQAKREKTGSVTLDVKEAKILFDSKKQKILIPDYKREFSHEIIEAFMVLANETVAEYMHSIDAPFIYRVHEKPTPEKVEDFRAFAQSLGLNARLNPENLKPYDYQNLLKSAENTPVYSLLNRVMLRSMQKARYESENLGHFGLASDCYCHFTSPIRRYPDLCIHRVIKDVIHGRYDEAQRLYGEFVSEAAKQASDTERKATEAERDVDDLYKTMYMSEHIGKDYEGIISGVAQHGLYVELPNTIEGFIPTESLNGYDYVFDPKKLCLRNGKYSYQIGECLKIRVRDVDFYRRRTEFELLEKL